MNCFAVCSFGDSDFHSEKQLKIKHNINSNKILCHFPLGLQLGLLNLRTSWESLVAH